MYKGIVDYFHRSSPDLAARSAPQKSDRLETCVPLYVTLLYV